MPVNLSADTGEEVYNAVCFACHNSGVMGAPKIDNKEYWAKEVKEEGLDNLYQVAIKGKGGMPAKGGRADLSDEQVKAAVDFMVKQ
tara:strand:- start:223 stop:480 length:258 start_codon:yes stop_codon:yes gene_type:complete